MEGASSSNEVFLKVYEGLAQVFHVQFGFLSKHSTETAYTYGYYAEFGVALLLRCALNDDARN